MSLDETLKRIVPIDRAMERTAQQRLDSLTKPPGSLGKLEEFARRIAVIQGKVPPRLGRKLLFVFAADHGIAEEGVSAYPKEVTAQMTYNFLTGGAAINVLARHYGIDTEVIDAGVDYDFHAPRGLHERKIRRATSNFARGPAMTRAEALRSVELGIELVREAAGNIFLLGAGDMGIGNTSSATATLCALTGLPPADVVGRGTGIDDATLARKIAALERGLEINRPAARRPARRSRQSRWFGNRRHRRRRFWGLPSFACPWCWTDSYPARRRSSRRGCVRTRGTFSSRRIFPRKRGIACCSMS